jgi:hypothetical protein
MTVTSRKGNSEYTYSQQWRVRYRVNRKLTLVLGGLELPESDIDGDTTLTLGLELVKNPSVLEGTLTEFGGFLLELLDGTLVNTTALVNQVTSSGGLARIDVTNDDDVNVSLFLTYYKELLAIRKG